MKTVLLGVLFLLVPLVASAQGKGWVKLWDDKGYTDRALTVSFGRDIGNMDYVSSDDGMSGFSDKASSAKYNIPAGWEAVLFEDDNFRNREFILRGKGSNPDLGYFNDKTSSLQWRRKTD